MPASDECAAAKLLALLGPGSRCRLVGATAIDHSGNGGVARDASAERAFDGDTCSVWNAGGFPPQAIRASIEDTTPITGVLLVPEMSPNGNASHVLSLDDKAFIVEASWTTAVGHFVVFDRPVVAKTITVRSTSSPSWVAWRAILPFACEALEIPSTVVEASPPTPEPPSKNPAPAEVTIPGKGACNADTDCVPATCCHPRMCASKQIAPRCEGIGCAQNVVPGTIGHGARCACEQGTCVTRKVVPPREPRLL